MDSEARFELGQVYVSEGVRARTWRQWVLDCIAAHALGDWESEEDAERGDEAIADGDTVYSHFEIPGGVALVEGESTLVIATSPDRTRTLVMLGSEVEGVGAEMSEVDLDEEIADAEFERAVEDDQ